MERMNGAARGETDEDAAEKQGVGDTAASSDTRWPPKLTEYLTRPSESWDKWISAELENIRGQRIPEYDAAISSGSVTLEQIVDVRYRLHIAGNSDKESSLIGYEKLLWQAYQRAHGKIKEYYFSIEGRIGAVLIKPHRRRKAMDLDFCCFRVANQPLTIMYTAGRGLIRLAGLFRPVVGAIFGLAFFVLINAGLLLATPHEMSSRAFFVAAICFAAGFSERRAQDVIVRALPVPKGPEPDADQSPARRPNGGMASSNSASS